MRLMAKGGPKSLGGLFARGVSTNIAEAKLANRNRRLHGYPDRVPEENRELVDGYTSLYRANVASAIAKVLSVVGVAGLAGWMILRDNSNGREVKGKGRPRQVRGGVLRIGIL